MKQKTNSTIANQELMGLIKDLVTKADLIDISKSLKSITKDVNTTKHDIKSIRNEIDSLEFKFDYKLDQVKIELDDNARQYRDQILTKYSLIAY